MENIITKLLGDFENGKMSRRQLIQSLALAATAASAASASVEPARQVGGFKTISLDHISYSVADYAKTRDFYSDLMGMTVAGDNGTNQCQLEFGDSLVIARNHRLEAGQEDPGPNIGHISYKIENWDTDRVRGELESRGLEPRLDRGPGGIYASFHVDDPDGYDLQISGDIQQGDSLSNEG